MNVSWNDVLAFCDWLGRREGRIYRLPSEAEWEYACRAGTTTRYYNGNDPEKLAGVGNVADGTLTAVFKKRPLGPQMWPWGRQTTISAKDGYALVAPVGRFQPNAWGLYDMHGNVQQWCSDFYGDTYYRVSPVDDPTGASDDDYDRVVRGSNFLDAVEDSRSSRRACRTPFNADFAVGFRVVMGAAAKPVRQAKAGQRQPAAPEKEPSTTTAAIRAVVTNSIGMKLALIPSGEFTMGSPDCDKGAYPDERPPHRVRIARPFYLGIYPVTRAQFERVLGTRFSISEFYKSQIANRKTEEKAVGELPVEEVGWRVAQEFCRALGEKEGKKYRLPTEAEWEYACLRGVQISLLFRRR